MGPGGGELSRKVGCLENGNKALEKMGKAVKLSSDRKCAEGPKLKISALGP